MAPRVTLAMLSETDTPPLSRCLASVADLLDEIIVVTQPGASRSWSLEVERHGARLIEFPWCDDFSAARNESLRHATGDWAFYLDADEWVDTENRCKLRELFASLPGGAAGYWFSQVSTTTIGRPSGIQQIRLFRREPGVNWIYRVHEQISPALIPLGPLADSGIAIEHDGYSDPGVQEKKRRRNARLAALDLRERPRDPWVLFTAGTAAHDIGKYPEAVRLLEDGLRRRSGAAFIPPAEEHFAMLARAYARCGDPARALAACRDGLAEAPESADVLYVEAAIRYRGGDLSGAETALQRCVGVRSTHGAAWQLLSDLKLIARHFDEAFQLANRLDAIAGMSVDAAVIRARAQLAKGDGKAATMTLDKAISAAPRALVLHELMANVLMVLGKRWAAKAALGRLLAIDPTNKWAANALSRFEASGDSGHGTLRSVSTQ